jgi:hypothetical protein
MASIYMWHSYNLRRMRSPDGFYRVGERYICRLGPGRIKEIELWNISSDVGWRANEPSWLSVRLIRKNGKPYMSYFKIKSSQVLERLW